MLILHISDTNFNVSEKVMLLLDIPDNFCLRFQLLRRAFASR